MLKVVDIFGSLIFGRIFLEGWNVAKAEEDVTEGGRYVPENHQCNLILGGKCHSCCQGVVG